MFRKYPKTIAALVACVILGLGLLYVFWGPIRRSQEPPFGQTSRELANAFLAGQKAASGPFPVSVQGAGPNPVWAIYGLSFNPREPGISLHATIGSSVVGNDTVSDLALAVPSAFGRPIAAMNADYFEIKSKDRYLGTLQGICIVDGELICAPNSLAFWIGSEKNTGGEYLDQGSPRIGKITSKLQITWPDGSVADFGLNCATADFKSQLRTAPLVLYTPSFGPTTQTLTAREMVLEPVLSDSLPMRPNTVFKARVTDVSADGNHVIPKSSMVLSVSQSAEKSTPRLVPGDTVSISIHCSPDMTGVKTAVSGSPILISGGKVQGTLNNATRHPRTAIGIRSNGEVLFVVVDGRQPDHSIGMTMLELANWMQMVGCTEALNLDGGGSSTLWFDGKILNSPSEGSQRAVGNALVLMRKNAG